MAIAVFTQTSNKTIFLKNLKTNQVEKFEDISSFKNYLKGLKNEDIIVFNENFKSFEEKFGYDFASSSNRLFSVTKLSSFSPKLKPISSLRELKLYYPASNEVTSFFKYCAQPEISNQINLRNNLINKYNLKSTLSLSTNATLIEMILSSSPKKDEKTYSFKYPFHIKPQTGHINSICNNILNGTPSANNFNIGNLKVSGGDGGLHAAKENFSGQEVWHVDAESLYPSIISKFHIATNNFNLKKYNEIYTSRINKKRILHMLKTNEPISFDKLINPSDELKKVLQTRDTKLIEQYASEQATEKLIINTAYGLFNNKYSSLFNSSIQKNIAHTGQLLILLLIDRLIKENLIDIVQINTDAVDFVPKNKEKILKIIEDFSQQTDFTFEIEKYKKYFQVNVSNYVAVGEDNKINAKGSSFKDFDSPILTNSQINDIINVEHICSNQPLEKIIKKKEYQQPKYFANIINFNNKKLKQGANVYDCPVSCLVVKDKMPNSTIFAKDSWDKELPTSTTTKKIDINTANKWAAQEIKYAKEFINHYNEKELEIVFNHFLKNNSKNTTQPFELKPELKLPSIFYQSKYKPLLFNNNFIETFLKPYCNYKEIVLDTNSVLSFLPEQMENLDLGNPCYYKNSIAFQSTVPGLPDENLLVLNDNVEDYIFDDKYNIYNKSGKLLAKLDLDFYLNKSKEVFKAQNFKQIENFNRKP